MKTVGYVRVSTDKQAEHGISLEAQAEKIRAMALVQGAELSEIIVAGEKASPREIEDVIMKHPAVAEAAVVGKKDPGRDGPGS